MFKITNKITSKNVNGATAKVIALAIAFLFASDAVPASASWWDDYIVEPTVAGWDSVMSLFNNDSGELPVSIDIVVSETSGDEMPGYLSKNWKRLVNNLSDTLERQENDSNLPDSKWFGFGDDKRSNAKEINKLMDAALEILLQGQATDLRREAAALQVKIPELRAEADQLRNDRITAPDEAKWQPWKKTKANIDERIAHLNIEISDSETRLAVLRSELAEALRELDLNLDQAQIDVLMNSVTGDDLLQNAVIFSNVKIVVAKLEELTLNNQNDLEINRRYTGMYLVLNDLLMHTQREVVNEIELKYKPRLLKIRQEAEALRRDADNKSRRPQYSQSQKNVFARNAETNAMTIQVTDLYTQLLDKQRKGLLENISKLQHNHDAAENTYKTVKNSSELRDTIKTGLTLFDSIQDFSDMPELQSFVDSSVMRVEFDEINRRLKLD